MSTIISLSIDVVCEVGIGFILTSRNYLFTLSETAVTEVVFESGLGNIFNAS